MMLYDIFYPSCKGFDRDVPIVGPPLHDLDYAVNTNWDRHRLYADYAGGKLVWCAPEALSLRGQRRHGVGTP